MLKQHSHTLVLGPLRNRRHTLTKPLMRHTVLVLEALHSHSHCPFIKIALLNPSVHTRTLKDLPCLPRVRCTYGKIIKQLQVSHIFDNVTLFTTFTRYINYEVLHDQYQSFETSTPL